MKWHKVIGLLVALLCSTVLYANDSVEELLQRGLECKRRGEYANAMSLYQDALSSASNIFIKQKIRYNTASLLLEMGQLDQSEQILRNLRSSLYRNYAALRLTELYWLREEHDRAFSLVDSLLEKVSPRDSMLYPFVLQNKAFFCFDRNPEDTLAYNLMQQAMAYYDRSSSVYNVLLSDIALLEANCHRYMESIMHIDEAIAFFQNTSDEVRLTRSLRKKAEILSMEKNWGEAQITFAQYFKREQAYLIANFAQMTEQNRLDFWKKEKSLLSEIFALENHAPDFLLDVAIFRREVALLGRTDSLDIPKRLSMSGREIRAALQKNEMAIDFVRYIKNDTVRYGAIIVPPLSSRQSVTFIPLWTDDEWGKYKAQICSAGAIEDKNELYSDDSLSHMIWDKIQPYICNAKNVYWAPDGILHMLAIEYLYDKIDIRREKHLHRLTSLSRLLYRSPRKPMSEQNILAIGGLKYSKIYSEHDTLSLKHDAADYLLNKNRDFRFNKLDYTYSEIESINTVSGSRVDTTTCMTEAMFDKLWRDSSYTIVHFGTHGYALHVDVPSVPYMMRDSITEDRSLWASGIALSGANKAHLRPVGEDAIISARELCEMDLRGIDMFVVSACQGAQGYVSDEGPAGLVRGLKKAGVRTVVATLWEIDDVASSMLMAAFYRYLNTYSASEALRRAQDEVRNYKKVADTYFDNSCLCSRTFDPAELSNRPVEMPYALPYYWAAFIVIDDI